MLSVSTDMISSLIAIIFISWASARSMAEPGVTSAGASRCVSLMTTMRPLSLRAVALKARMENMNIMVMIIVILVLIVVVIVWLIAIIVPSC